MIVGTLAALAISRQAIADDAPEDDSSGTEATSSEDAAGSGDADGDAASAPVEAPKPKKHHKKHKRKVVPEDEATATVTEPTPRPLPVDDHGPARVTASGELLGAAPVDRANRYAYSRGGGGSLGLEVYLSPLLGVHAAATMIALGTDLAMKPTTWLAGQVGPRLHFAHLLFGEQTPHDAWIDAHVEYGASGGIRRPGFDLGAAIQWELASALRVGPVVRYQFGADPRSANAQLFTNGLAVGFGGHTRVAPMVVSDRDDDGIADTEDPCPDEAPGSTPDPDRAGCPLVDQDGDGIADDADRCPTEAAGAEPDPDADRAGCPAPPADTDGDGIADDQDRCPRVAGVANTARPAKHGCPKLASVVANKIEILQQVFFETDSATIKPESAEVLEAVGAAIKTLDGAAIRIEGHTDDQGSDAHNLDLSKRRARAVAQWLIQNAGIDAAQLTTQGYGKSRPIVSGGDADEGQNRRVEFVILEHP